MAIATITIRSQERSTNESNKENQEVKTEALTDLTVENDEQVKGGGGARISKMVVDNDSTTSGDSFYGTGVYKSVDGGETWT